MQWPVIRKAYPNQWLIIEAEAHTTTVDNRRQLDKIAVIVRYSDGRAAMKCYRRLHQNYPNREFYFVYTGREVTWNHGPTIIRHSEKIEVLSDIKELIKQTTSSFYHHISKDKNHRYKSWEHCYSYFLQSEIKEDIASLHLAYYLASWGMYRGSSFLLWKDYLIYEDIIKEIRKNKELQEIDFLKEDEAIIDNILDLANWIRDWFKKNVESVNGVKKETINATNTLVTKILLGTLGCIPAYDRFFKYGLSTTSIGPGLNKANFKKIIIFYRDNQKAFKDIQVEISSRSKVPYPIMKLIDMHFWKIGFDNRESSHNNIEPSHE